MAIFERGRSLALAETPSVHGPWMDKTLSPDRRADLVLQEMTLDEKIALLHGNGMPGRSEEHTSELQSRLHLVCRLLLEKKTHISAVTIPDFFWTAKACAHPARPTSFSAAATPTPPFCTLHLSSQR